LKTDKYIKDVARRLDDVVSNGNGHDASDDEFQDYHDEYCLDIGSEPLRFAYYRHLRIQNSNDEYRKKSCDAASDSITQDELDYYLKRKLRVPPEERYQHAKKDWFFHELSYLHQTWDDNNGRFVDVVKEYGCGRSSNKEGVCVPECRYYPKYGRIEDDEVIAEHREAEEHRKTNTIVNIDIDKKDFLEFAKRFYNTL
jgi:hypothetical protein